MTNGSLTLTYHNVSSFDTERLIEVASEQSLIIYHYISNLAKCLTGKAIGNQQKEEPKFWRHCDEASMMQ